MSDEYDKTELWNQRKNVRGHRPNLLFSNVVDGEWKDPSISEVKWTFKLYLIAIAALFIAGAAIAFNYLGGIEGLLTSKLLVDGTESLPTYIEIIMFLVVSLFMAIFLLYLALKKRK